MRMLIIGSLSGELAKAAQMVMATGAKLDQADSLESALPILRREARIDLVLCDLAHDVGALVQALAAERIAIPVVACGVDAEADAAVRAIRAGAREFLPLPPDAELIAAILAAAAGDSHAVVVRDPAMLATLRRAEQVAGADASVLLTGESGTGKEVLARHIHRHSRRAGGAFVALNCAAIPENLLESELFGHEKGAFSGAQARRIGKFEAADGGTLLLDEIGEMDIRLQAKLLRAVQEREIDRIGGAAPVRVNVRILATTNRDLLAEGARGQFREDLYFRLNVVNLRIPPLCRGERAGVSPADPCRAAAAGGAWLARQCARAGEHAAPRRAAGAWREHRYRRDRAGAGRRGRLAGAARRRRRGRAGRAAHGGGGARPDRGDAAAHAGQPHPCGDHPGHLDPRAAQQVARLRGAGRRGAAAGGRRGRLMGFF